MVELAGVVIFLLTLFFLCVGILNWDTARRQPDHKEEESLCYDCNRWEECNGVDSENCTLCKKG